METPAPAEAAPTAEAGAEAAAPAAGKGPKGKATGKGATGPARVRKDSFRCLGSAGIPCKDEVGKGHVFLQLFPFFRGWHRQSFSGPRDA